MFASVPSSPSSPGRWAADGSCRTFYLNYFALWYVLRLHSVAFLLVRPTPPLGFGQSVPHPIPADTLAIQKRLNKHKHPDRALLGEKKKRCCSKKIKITFHKIINYSFTVFNISSRGKHTLWIRLYLCGLWGSCLDLFSPLVQSRSSWIEEKKKRIWTRATTTWGNPPHRTVPIPPQLTDSCRTDGSGGCFTFEWLSSPIRSA